MKAKDPGENEVEVFLPARSDDNAVEHEEFLAEVRELVESGHRITVYQRGVDDWAFDQCDPVAEILEINGDGALPITLLGPDIMGMYAYPTAQKLARLAETPVNTPKEATNACTPSGGPARKDSPIKGLMRMGTPEPRGPEIGNRWNLMGGDTGQGMPRG